MEIFPNPFSDFMQINANTDIDEIELFTSSGKLVYKNLKSNSGSIHIPTADLAVGQYLLRLKSGSKELIRKVVKQ